MDELNQLTRFRESLCSLFLKRKDAIMNLLDALTSHGHEYRSVIQLSQSPFFERQYSSITEAIADGLVDAPWDTIRKLSYDVATAGNLQPTINRFIVDCTGNRRSGLRAQKRVMKSA